jgi:integrase
VDEGLHYLQGKAKRVTATELLDLLREFRRDKLTMLRRHEAVARHISDYDFNNTYQYVIAREDMHVTWVRDALLDVAASTMLPASEPEDIGETALPAAGKGTAEQRPLISADRDSARAFVAKWRPRVERMTHARHRTMLNVILGETLEHGRFFDLALEGRADLLGRRDSGASTGGGVLPTRWV